MVLDQLEEELLQFQPKIQEDPILFYDHVLGCPHWSVQDEVTLSVFQNQKTTVRSCHGIGKCLAKGTPVLMGDGTVKPVEELKVGELVMGMDSTPRRILDTVRGKERMYRISPKKGEAFTVTGDHRLTLRKSGSMQYKRGSVPNGTIVDITVKDYLSQNSEFKDRYRLFRVPVDFPTLDIPIDPYFFGLWLGDGSSNRAAITTQDREIKEYTYETAGKYGLKISINRNKEKSCPTYVISKGRQQKTRNVLLDQLGGLGVRNNKHIPLCYKRGTKKQRLQLLAGIIDTDGSLVSNMYEVTTKHKQLADDIAFVARSLGFAAYIKTKMAKIKKINYECLVYRVFISGDCSKIPVRLERKKAKPRMNDKNVLNVGFTVEPLEHEQEYYGIQVDGDERFLLGDFTVTHNSYIAARIGMAFLYAFRDSIVVTTAPTFRQVQNVIWREWRGAFSKAKIPLGKVPLKVSQEISENWYALGFSANKADNFQGLHAASGHMLVIVDEAAGASAETMIAIDALLTSKDVHVLYIGNPTSPIGEFYESHKSPQFKKIKVSVFDTPNFKYNRIRTIQDLKAFTHMDQLKALPLPYPQLVTPAWAWDKMHKWGENNPVFLSRVLAEFPEEGSDILIPLYLVDKALSKEFDEKEWERRPVCNVIGVDVARFGEDNTVFTAVDNYKMVASKWFNGKDTMKTVGEAQALMRELGWTKQYTTFVVDDTGVGGGVVDRLKELGFNVIPVNFGAGASDSELYANMKAEIFWHLRQLFIDGAIQILDEGNVVAEIPTVRYNYRSNSQLEIVSKQQMKKDGLKSPDFADSLALACWGVRGGTFSVVDPSVGSGETVAGNLYNKKF